MCQQLYSEIEYESTSENVTFLPEFFVLSRILFKYISPDPWPLGPGSHHPNRASIHPGLVSFQLPSWTLWQDPQSSADPPPPGGSSFLVLEHSHGFVWTCTDSPNLQLFGLYIRGFLATDRGHGSQPAHCLTPNDPCSRRCRRACGAACGLLSTPQASPPSAYALRAQACSEPAPQRLLDSETC